MPAEVFAAPAAAPVEDAALAALWRSPLAAALLDADFAFVALNAACEQLVGKGAATLHGQDLALLVPPGDRDAHRAQRLEALQAAGPTQGPPALSMRMRPGSGLERWLSVTLHELGAGAPGRWLVLLQDVSAEQAARAEALRVQSELEQWFELAGAGMLVYDEAGLIVRSNGAFETLVERVPETVIEAGPELRALLGWDEGGMTAELLPHAAPLHRQALIVLADGGRRRLASRLACYLGENGSRRVMAVVEDRSAEDERDLAQLEMGMLMSTASIGVATFDPGRGWLGGRASAGHVLEADGTAEAGGTAAAGFQTITRELVAPESLPDYERLQRALREGERAEVRYAVQHPVLGTRWLLTRVEPGALAGGRSTTSVVTLDVTGQELANRRSAQLLRELTTILDSSPAGIAYLRGPVLVRCNRRFERILGFAPGASAGATLAEILGGHGVPRAAADAALAALSSGDAYETEIELAPEAAGAPPRWVALSVRRAVAQAAGSGGAAAGAEEAVAVLTDITRLKAQQAEAERLLRERELMFNLSDVGIVYQRGPRIERANQAMAQLTGYSVPELSGLDPAELYESARDCVAFEAKVTEALRHGGRFAGERRLRRRDGSLRWVQVTIRPVRLAEGAEGEPTDVPADDPTEEAGAFGTLCSYVDVDDRRRAREALALQAERTRAVLNSVLVGIVTVSEQGIEWMNRSARRMFAGELADFVGEPISTVATPEADHPLRRTDWWQRASEGRIEAFECRLRGRDGREFWVVGNAVASALDEGAPQLTFALLDIERRRQAEVQIARAQASLQRLIETAPLAIALFDTAQGLLVQSNPAAAALFGVEPAAAAGRRVHELPHAELGAALGAWLARAAAGEAVHEEWREPRSDGEGGPRVWDMRVAPVPAQGEAVVEQVMLLASDVTEQRVAEQARLREAIAQREVLVREVHHRIKNNLQGVAGLLKQNAARHPEVAEMLTEAVGQVQAIAQVYGLQVGVQGGPLSVVQLVQAIAASVQRTFGRTVEVTAAPLALVLPEAEAIPVALTVNELLTNAIKHGQEGGVQCAVQADGAGIAIRVLGLGALPVGFELERVPAGVSGLGLVRALLPRRSSKLSLTQEGAQVVATVVLQPPSVRPPQPLPE